VAAIIRPPQSSPPNLAWPTPRLIIVINNNPERFPNLNHPLPTSQDLQKRQENQPGPTCKHTCIINCFNWRNEKDILLFKLVLEYIFICKTCFLFLFIEIITKYYLVFYSFKITLFVFTLSIKSILINFLRYYFQI